MTIDEAIEVYKHPTQHFSSEHREADKIAIQSMKELKLLRAELKSHILYDKELAETKMFQLGYNKAIYDFAERLKSEYERYDIDYVFENSDISYTKACYIFEQYIEQIAEQLKEGVENE